MNRNERILIRILNEILNEIDELKILFDNKDFRLNNDELDQLEISLDFLNKIENKINEIL